MNFVLAALVGLFIAVAIYFLLSRALIRMLLGLVVLGNGINLLIFTAGRVGNAPPPIIAEGLQQPAGAIANPLPQALILTAIVIGFAMFSFLLVLAFRAYQAMDADNTDHMRLAEPESGPAAAIELLGKARMAELSPTIFTGTTALADWVIVLPVVLGLLGAALALMARRAAMGLALLAVVAIIACDALLLQRVLQDGPLSMTMGRWLPPFGISFAVDGFGAGFALAAAVVTLVVLVYGLGEPAETGFYSLVLLLLAGVSGAFLTGDLFNLYVWFEVMLIASFGLIVLGGRPLQLDGAVKYGFINFLATSFFLVALGLLYGSVGTLNMADIVIRAPGANGAAMSGVAALMLLAFGIKAAVVPLNGWLPASYHTPSPAVSALLAGLLTKVGAYAMLRVLVMLLPGARAQLDWVLAAIAIATLVIGPLGAIAETNLRRAIGFMLIGGIGAIMAGIAMPSLHGVGGAGLYIVHAMLTLTGLYLVAGLVEKLTGQTDSRKMGGLYGAHAPVSILFFILVLSVAGVPPFLGFWPKLLLLEGGLGDADLRGAGETGIDWLSLAIVLALLVNAVLTLIAGTRLWGHIFWREGPVGEHSEYRGAPLNRLSMRQNGFGFGAVTALTLLIVLAGLWPSQLFDMALTGAGDILDPARYLAMVPLAGAVP